MGGHGRVFQVGLGLAKSIGVSNFGTLKLSQILHNATIPPAVNQVEMNPSWQQRKLRDLDKEKGIHVSTSSPLGVYGASSSATVPRSFNKERMKQSLEIFNWELSEDEMNKIKQIPQPRLYAGDFFVYVAGPYKSLHQLWDGDP